MTKANFTLKINELIVQEIEMSKIQNNLYQMGISVIDSQFNSIHDNLLKNYVSLLLNEDEEKIDTFYWFIYEYMPNVLAKGKEMTIETAQMWDKDENPICYNVLTLAEYLYES
jgi:hypothetical protein